jgi:hypothetical protein
VSGLKEEMLQTIFILLVYFSIVFIPLYFHKSRFSFPLKVWKKKKTETKKRYLLMQFCIHTPTPRMNRDPTTTIPKSINRQKTVIGDIVCIFVVCG